jgi:dUTP pyrophosphatase
LSRWVAATDEGRCEAVPDGCSASKSGALRRRVGIIGAMQIPLKRLDLDLPVPVHAHPGDGGVDLYAREQVALDPGERVTMPTGVAVAIPDGYAGLVIPRSGLARRHGIGVVNSPGLVDAGYRGEIGVVLVNHGDETVEIERGERVAQLVVLAVTVQEMVEVDELPDSLRAEGGFGSTGR